MERKRVMSRKMEESSCGEEALQRRRRRWLAHSRRRLGKTGSQTHTHSLGPIWLAKVPKAATVSAAKQFFQQFSQFSRPHPCLSLSRESACAGAALILNSKPIGSAKGRFPACTARHKIRFSSSLNIKLCRSHSLQDRIRIHLHSFTPASM